MEFMELQTWKTDKALTASNSLTLQLATTTLFDIVGMVGWNELESCRVVKFGGCRVAEMFIGIWVWFYGGLNVYKTD